MNPTHSSAETPKPFTLMQDETGHIVAWLASAYSPIDIRDEWDYYFEGERPKVLREAWVTLRWTTPEELADEDALCDLFGDWEAYGIDTSVVPSGLSRERKPGAHRYWTVDP